MLPLQIQRGPLDTMPLFWLLEGPDATAYPSPEKGYLNVPHTTGTLKISQEITVCLFVFPSSGLQMFCQQDLSSCYFLQ